MNLNVESKNKTLEEITTLFQKLKENLSQDVVIEIELKDLIIQKKTRYI